MIAEQGWYHYPGDPEGTVRLWNGRDWVGFPSKPPPGYGGASIESEASTATAQRPIGRQFKNQVRLAPFAALALLGLAVTAVFAVRAIQELRSALDANQDRSRPFVDADSILVSPFSADVYRQLLIVGIVGGLFFLIWLWRANTNIGAQVRAKRNTRRQFGFKWFVFGWAFLALEGIFREVFGPVITRMFNSIERSTPGGTGGMGLTIIGFLWWVLWIGSGLGFLITAVALTARDVAERSDQIQLWANLQTAAVAAHILSLLFAMVLVVSITMQQDRRLGH